MKYNSGGVWFGLWALIIVLGGRSDPALARPAMAVALRCDVAAEHASRATGVPAAVMMAIARVETGRTIEGSITPWPWTVNEAGAGSFFDTAEQAILHVNNAISAGGRNIDIGCFQVNIRWHGKAFATVEDMFDPAKNAGYAAKFLQMLYDEHGNWDGAVGAYHSRNSDAADRYVKKVADVLDVPRPAHQPTDLATKTAGGNRFPLLQGGGGGNGSLVSSSASGAQPLLR